MSYNSDKRANFCRKSGKLKKLMRWFHAAAVYVGLSVVALIILPLELIALFVRSRFGKK